MCVYCTNETGGDDVCVHKKMRSFGESESERGKINRAENAPVLIALKSCRQQVQLAVLFFFFLL